MHKLYDEFPSRISQNYSFSSPFSLIRSPLDFSSFFPCQHDSFIPQSPLAECGNCKDCGVFLNKSTNAFGLKTKKNSFKLDISSRLLIENFNQSLTPHSGLNQASSYAKNRSSLIDWLFDMAKKLELSLNSAHLALVYMDILMSKEKEEVNRIHLFSTTSLLLAAKAIELDERIPFLPKLRKMAAPMYNNDDFKKAEREILSSLDWKLQLPTFFDFLEYYVSQGLVFSCDQINGEEINQNSMSPSPDGHLSYKEQKFASPFINNERSRSFLGRSGGSTGIQSYGKISNEKKIYEMISTMEKDVVKLAGIVVKDIFFFEWDLRILAAAGVAFLRKINNITPLWNKELEKISLGVTEDELRPALDSFINKYSSHFETYIFQHTRPESSLIKEFNNLKINKENATSSIPNPLLLKKANTVEETTKETPEGFAGYLRSYTLGLDPDPISFPRANPGMNRISESKRLYSCANVAPSNVGGKNFNYNLNGVSHLSRNHDDYLSSQYILKDAENKLNIYNNGFKSYFQEKNSGYSDINLRGKVDEFYGKIFNNHPINKKV